MGDKHDKLMALLTELAKRMERGILTPEEKEFTQRMRIALEQELAKPGHMSARLKALREAADAGDKLAADLLRQWSSSPKLATLLGGN